MSCEMLTFVMASFSDSYLASVRSCGPPTYFAVVLTGPIQMRRFSGGTNAVYNARTSQTKHTQPITRSHGLPDMLWITRFGLDLAEWHHFVPGIFGQNRCGEHSANGPDMAHIRYLCTTSINFRSEKHYTTLGVDGHGIPTSDGTQFGHREE